MYSVSLQLCPNTYNLTKLDTLAHKVCIDDGRPWYTTETGVAYNHLEMLSDINFHVSHSPTEREHYVGYTRNPNRLNYSEWNVDNDSTQGNIDTLLIL